MAAVKRIPKEDFFGIFYVRKPEATLWNVYYGTIDALRPLLAEKEFSKVISGFYINYNYKEQVTRISYFVNTANLQEAVSMFQEFFKKNAILEVKFEPPREETVAKKYGGKELEERFRYFLNLETQIGLELLRTDLLQARILFATYCLRVRKGRLPVREHFESTFTKNSPTYASLPMEEREQFLRDLERLSWAHMMVNLVLGCDFNVPQDGLALSIPEINEILRASSMEFEVPSDWKP